MAQKYYFFNSAPGDERMHQASDFARYFGNVLTSGLFSLDNQIGLRVRSDGTDMRSYVEIGKALIKGFAYENDADEYLLHDLPEVANNRIDRVVLRLDLRNQNRFIKVFVKSGVTAEEPVPPTLQRDNFIFELSLAQIVVRANTSTINPADITDERLDEQLCGVVNSMITVPTSQFQDDWNDWYAANIPQYESEWQDFINGLAGATFVQTVNGTGPDVNGNVEVAVDTTGIDAELDAMSAQIGILSGLNTTSKVDLVSATNEVNAKTGTLSSLNTTNKTNLVNAVNELFTDVGNGKTQIATAITDKGVTASGGDTFPTLATKIGQIINEPPLVAGDELMVYNDTTSRSQKGMTYVKSKEFMVNKSGNVRVSFSLQAGYEGDGTPYHYGRIYINDVAVGLERVVQSSSFRTATTYTQDFNVSNGDKIALYLKTSTMNTMYLVVNKDFNAKIASNYYYYTTKLK